MTAPGVLVDVGVASVRRLGRFDATARCSCGWTGRRSCSWPPPSRTRGRMPSAQVRGVHPWCSPGSPVRPYRSAGQDLGQQRRLDVAARHDDHRRPRRRLAAAVGGERRGTARFGHQVRPQRDLAHRRANVVLRHRDHLVEHPLQMGERQLRRLRSKPVGDGPVAVLDRPVDPMPRRAGSRRCRRRVRVRRRSPAPPGTSALTAVPMPEARPPPLTGTMTLATSGRSSAISSPMVPCPAMTSGMVERRDQHPAGRGHHLVGDLLALAGRAQHHLGAVAAGGVDLDRRASPPA